jgi:hypothetical protein
MTSEALNGEAVTRPAVNPWFVAVAVVVPTYIEILDTAIATASPRYIAGGLSATMKDSEWVRSSCLAANATILTFTGWISVQLGGRRRRDECEETEPRYPPHRRAGCRRVSVVAGSRTRRGIGDASRYSKAHDKPSCPIRPIPARISLVFQQDPRPSRGPAAPAPMVGVAGLGLAASR